MILSKTCPHSYPQAACAVTHRVSARCTWLTPWAVSFHAAWLLSFSFVDPLSAAIGGELAAEAQSPVQSLGDAVVRPVPARVLHQCQRQPRVHWILRVSARHCFILNGIVLLYYVIILFQNASTDERKHFKSIRMLLVRRCLNITGFRLSHIVEVSREAQIVKVRTHNTVCYGSV